MLYNPNFISRQEYGFIFHLIVYSVVVIKCTLSPQYEKGFYAKTTPITV